MTGMRMKKMDKKQTNKNLLVICEIDRSLTDKWPYKGQKESCDNSISL